MRRLVSIIGPLLCVSCAISQPGDTSPEDRPIDNEPGATDVILCEEPRPQVCTREYRPVCASMIDGSNRTYATGCTSCADESVVSYRSGSC